MRSRRVRAIACDYDRTLTGPALEPAPEAMRALERARATGCKIVIVSGRDAAFLRREIGHVADALVAENGALVLAPRGQRALVATAGLDLRGALADLDIDVEHGEVIASADASHEPLVREALARAGLDARIIPNRDRIMVLPAGVDKAAGLLAALKLLEVDPSETVAFGDGENDVVLLGAAGWGVAVANAVETLKEHAHEVTREAGGRGVAAWIQERVLQEATAWGRR